MRQFRIPCEIAGCQNIALNFTKEQQWFHNFHNPTSEVHARCFYHRIQETDVALYITEEEYLIESVHES